MEERAHQRARRSEMGKAFEIVNEIDVGATPEQAWQAISTGEGMDGWKSWMDGLAS
jgi:hypothetical protein